MIDRELINRLIYINRLDIIISEIDSLVIINYLKMRLGKGNHNSNMNMSSNINNVNNNYQSKRQFNNTNCISKDGYGGRVNSNIMKRPSNNNSISSTCINISRLSMSKGKFSLTSKYNSNNNNTNNTNNNNSNNLSYNTSS